MNEKELREKFKAEIEKHKFDCDSIDVDINEEMTDREIKEKKITVLAEYYYNEFEFLKDDSFNNFLNTILDYFLDRNFTIEEINDQLINAIVEKRLSSFYKEMDREEKEKKEKVVSKLEKLIEIFSLYGIDYMISGSLGVELQNKNLDDVDFSNIEILINEKDLPKLMSICSKYNLEFNDNRFDSSNKLDEFTSEDVSISSKLHNFSVKFTCFERNKEGDMIIKNYFTDEYGEPASLNEYNSREYVDEYIGHNMVRLGDKTVLVASPEFILLSMLNKKRDMNNIKDYVDMDRFNTASNGDRRVEVVNLNRSYDDSLEDMFSSSLNSKENAQEQPLRKLGDEKPKTFIKINPNISEEGFVRLKEICFSGVLCAVVVLAIILLF